MSVCRKLPDGTIQKIAGHTILLDANVSEIRQGTFNIQGVAGTDTSVQVTFSDPMPDTDYVVIYEYHSWGGYPVNTEPSPVTCISKTTTGFTARLWCFADMSGPMIIKYTAFKLVKLDGYTELQNKVNNPDSTPTEDSLNFVTSGGVYDAILSASKIFINSESAWNELDAETKATYQVAILTDKPTVNAVDSTDGSTTVVANKNLVFKGTLDEWEALTTAEKKTYDQALITNDTDTGEVVNAVTDGDMRAVTSNAVHDAITNLTPVDAVTDGSMKAVTSNAVYDAIAQIKTETKARYKALSFNSIPGATFARRDNNPKALSATRVDNIIVLNYSITLQGTYTGASSWLPIFDASQLNSLLDDDEILNDSVTPYFCSGITYTNNASYNKLDGIMNGYYLYFYNSAVFDMGIQGQIILGVQKTS